MESQRQARMPQVNRLRFEIEQEKQFAQFVMHIFTHPCWYRALENFRCDQRPRDLAGNEALGFNDMRQQIQNVAFIRLQSEQVYYDYFEILGIFNSVS